MLEVEN
jgi:chromosome segregation ATPase